MDTTSAELNNNETKELKNEDLETKGQTTEDSEIKGLKNEDLETKGQTTEESYEDDFEPEESQEEEKSTPATPSPFHASVDSNDSPSVPGQVSNDSTDEQRQAAAMKLQAGFKGIHARKEVERRKAQKAQEMTDNETKTETFAESTPPPIRVSSPIEPEKGQLESDSQVKENSEVKSTSQVKSPTEVKETSKVSETSDNESEPDVDAYNFTEDQKRAMMELLVQKQEDVDLLDEEPPEYDVKDRIEQLNAELANEPQPDNRETKVGFKEEIVDLVAPPPPDFSEDEDSRPNSARGEPQPLSAVNKQDTSKNGSSEDLDKKQYVVERDGNFEVVSSKDMTAEERAIYVQEDDKNTEQQSDNDKAQSSNADLNQNNNSRSVRMVPTPPSRPRPSTAAAGPRRNVRPATSPRPKSASHSTHSSTSLDNFRYNSPYAMTPEQKEQAREMMQRKEEEQRAREKRKREEEQEKKYENETAFAAWLEAKREKDEKNRQQNGEDEKTSQQKKEENLAAFNDWLKEKRSQGKKDKLLKRRQQQEQMEGFYIRPREECDKAFREWLKKKDLDLRRQQAMDKQRSKMYRMQARKCRKTSALIRAMKDSQAFRYIL